MLRLLFALALLLPLPALAQSVTGTVLDATTGEPLPGVNVTVEGAALGAASDAEGRYAIASLPSGTHVLVASSVGFKTQRRPVVVRPGQTATVDFLLGEEPLDIGEVVVMARETLTGGPAGIRDLPGSAHYVGLEQLRSHADADIGRVLREIPGVNVQEEDGYGLRPNIGLRGTGSERSSKITLMEDGVLIAPAPYAAPAAYYFPTVGRMSGVEVRKGASQVRYGPYTTGGALNLLSTQIPAEFSGYAEGFVGENQARNLHAWVGDRYRHAAFLVEAHVANVQGFKNLFPFEDADTGFDKQDYLAKLRLNTSPDAAVYQALTLKLGRTAEISNETYLGLTDADFAASPFLRYAGSQMDRMDADHTQAQLRHVAVFSERFDLTTTAYRHTFARNWYKLDSVRDGLADDGTDDAGNPVDRAVGIAAILADPEQYADELALIRGAMGDDGRLADGRLTVKANNREYLSYGVQSVAGLRLDLGPATSEVEIGLRLHHDEADRFQWADAYAMADGIMNRVARGTPGTDSNRIDDATAAAAFAQAEVRLGRLTLTPGLRFEHITLRRRDFGKADPERTGASLTEQENTVDVWIPGLGVGYQVTEALHAFASLHRGFAPPSSQPGVEPEQSVNTEAGVRYETDALGLQAVGYYNAYSNLLGADFAAGGGTGTGDLYNGGAARVFGAEVSASADLAQPLGARGFALPARLAYTFTDAEFRSSFESDFGGWGTVEEGDELPYVARHQLAASLGLERGRYRIEARGSYVGAMRAVAGSGAIPADAEIEPHVVFDLSGEVDVDGRTSVFGGVRNVLDEVYVAARQPAGLRPGLPRTFLLGVRTAF